MRVKRIQQAINTVVEQEKKHRTIRDTRKKKKRGY